MAPWSWPCSCSEWAPRAAAAMARNCAGTSMPGGGEARVPLTAVDALTQITGRCAQSATPASSHCGKLSPRTAATGSSLDLARVHGVRASGPRIQIVTGAPSPPRRAGRRARRHGVVPSSSTELVIS